jgi:hypothetical protein
MNRGCHRRAARAGHGVREPQTHDHELRRGDLVSPPSGRRIAWAGCDVIPCVDGLIKRKDVYSDSVGILRQVGLLS